MCLFLKTNVLDENTFKTAKEDLAFYKVLLYLKNVNVNVEDGERYATPYRGMPVKLGELYQDVEPNYFVTQSTMAPGYERCIFGGGFHLFRDYADALDFGEMFSNSRVVRAIVPKGTRYAVGDYKLCRFGRVYKSAVAKSVIYYEQPKEEL